MDSNLKASGVGTDLVLRDVGGRGARPVEQAAEEAYASIDAALRERGCVPVQERVFGDLAAAPAGGAGRGARGREPARLGRAADVRRGLAGRPRRPLGHPRDRRARERRGRWSRATGSTAGSSRARRRASWASRTSAGGRPAGWPPGRPRTRRRRSTPRRSCWPGRASPSATWRAPGSTCATSWTGTGRSTRCATPRSGGWGSWARAATGRSRPAPASRGATPRGGWCALDLLALQATRRAAARDGAAPQPEAERGDRVRLGLRPGDGGRVGDARYIFVSGTASIDDHGATVHVGDFEAQTRYTLEAVEALLEGAGARPARRRAGHGLPQEPLRRPRLRARSSSGRRCGRAPRDDGRRRVPRRPAVRDRRRRSCRSAAGAAVTGRRRPGGAARAASLAARPRRWRGGAAARPARGAAAPIVVAQVPAAGARRRALAGGTLRAGPARGAGSCSSRRAGSRASSPPASTAPPTPRSPSTGSRSCSRGRRRRPTPGASGR